MTCPCESIYDEELKIWQGPTEDYDTSRPVGEVLLANLKRQGDKVIQIFHDTKEEMTASEMYAKSIKLATKLRLAGIRQGDIVTVNLKNIPNSTVVMVALFSLGVIINVLDQNNLTNPKGDSNLLKRISPKFIICHEAVLNALQSHLEKISLDVKIFTIDGESNGEFKSVVDILASDDDQSEFIPPVIDDTKETVALILASSGTTGAPKAICLSHAMLISQIRRCTVIVDWGTLYNPSPLDWISGIDCLLGAIMRGKVRVISTLPVTPQLIVDIILDYNVTDSFADPSRMFAVDQILKARKIQLPTVRLLGCAGTLVSEDLRVCIEECFPNAKVAIAYGLTEIGGLGTASLAGNRGFSVGCLLRGIQVKIQGKNGERLGPTEVGEIFLKTGQPFLGYYGDEVATNTKRDSDGWLCTDDMGYFDEEGYMYIVSRKQDLLQYLNHVINPVDIETVIEKHPGIYRAVVVAVSVPVYNDIPAAVCVKAPGSTVTAEELQQWLEDKVPDNHKLRGGIYFIDALPITANGKIKKIVCKGMAFQHYHEQKLKKEIIS